jgi:hypothetical protein
MSKTVILALNIGAEDARKYGLGDKRKAGTTVEVEDEAADALIAAGLAAEPGEDPPQGGGGAVPEGEERPEREPGPGRGPRPGPPPQPPNLDEMTKEDLKTYADAHGIEGVTMAMAKDDMLRQIRRAGRTR